MHAWRLGKRLQDPPIHGANQQLQDRSPPLLWRLSSEFKLPFLDFYFFF